MPKFGDILKSVEDIFKKDFAAKGSSPVTFEMTADAPKGVSVTSESTYDFKNAIATSVSCEWAHPSGFKLDKLEFNPSADGNFTTETSLTGLAKGLKLEFKGNDSNKGDLSFVYTHPKATFTGKADANAFKSFEATAAAVFDDLSAGLKAVYGKDKKVAVDVAASYKLGFKNTFIGFNATNNFKAFKGLMSLAVDSKITAAAVAEKADAKSDIKFTAGGVYKCNANTTIKAKVDLAQKLDFSVKQAVDKSLTVTTWTTINKFDFKGATFGAKAVLG